MSQPLPRKIKREPRVEGWFRPLNDGRLEVYLKASGLKVRCSGSEDEINAFVDLFEHRTGLIVNGPVSDVFTRKRSGPKPLVGQMNIYEVTDAPEVEEEATLAAWTPGLGGD